MNLTIKFKAFSAHNTLKTMHLQKMNSLIKDSLYNYYNDNAVIYEAIYGDELTVLVTSVVIDESNIEVFFIEKNDTEQMEKKAVITIDPFDIKVQPIDEECIVEDNDEADESSYSPSPGH